MEGVERWKVRGYEGGKVLNWEVRKLGNAERKLIAWLRR